MAGSSTDKSIRLGHPSYVWGFGQQRRLDMIRRHAPLEEAAILDAGAGVGTYVRAFRRFSSHVYGVDLDPEKLVGAAADVPGLSAASVEALPFSDSTFDLVLSHEVIEHVSDDRQAVAEAVRVLRAPNPATGQRGGRLVLFAPNRLYPFETHGAYWGGTYHFGNIPLVNYLPDRWRRRLAPHVRAYTPRGLRRLLAGLPVRIIAHTQVYPGYDKILRRRPGLGRVLRAATYLLEHTPLRVLGLSHLLVVEKIDPPG
ncbi:MAG: class I SAM-dependent methyltransferase [Anaerolineae bacterium]|nr:class I SAM-dependent methyltransferase [Anaerolineae bacterium]